MTGACCASKRRLLVVLLYFGSATASQSRLQVRTPFSQSAQPPVPLGLERLHLPLWRVKRAAPPPVRAPPPSGKQPDLGKALVVAAPMHVARRLATVNVSPSDNLQTKLTNAGAGDTLVLADGTYRGSGSNVLEISKDITIRAQNSGQAIVDGENTRRVIYITSGTVTLEGLKITRGYSAVRYPCPAELRAWTLTNSIAPMGCSLSLTCLLCLAVWRWRLHIERHCDLPVLRDLLEHCLCTFCKTPPKRHLTRHHALSHRPNGVLALLTCYVWLPCAHAAGKLATFYS